jgi:hypothetical protein
MPYDNTERYLGYSYRKRNVLVFDPSGAVIDWGRHGSGGEGNAVIYRGEHAEIMRLVLRYSNVTIAP